MGRLRPSLRSGLAMTDMRKINTKKVTEAVRKLVMDANTRLRPDIKDALTRALKIERKASAKNILKQLIENAKIASKESLAICQDTGMAVIFAEVGQDVALEGADIRRAINDGVRLGYKDGYFRNSVVDGPFTRKNTRTNTPAIIHMDIVKGDRVKITALPKGFGCENKSAVKMFDPTSDIGDIEDFVLDTVKRAGADACPPFIVGIGIGGTMDYACLLAKKALFVKCKNQRSKTKDIVSKLEGRLLARINRLNIGPMGLGGKTTALCVNILTYPTHIAGLPVAVNIGCHATRSAGMMI